MKTTKQTLLCLIILSMGFTSGAFAGGAQSNGPTVAPVSCPGSSADNINDDLSCYSIQGWSKGNHEIDCTVIVPDGVGDNIPLIAWANGWDQGNVVGQNTTNGYLKGLKFWAKAGPYVVVAANQWSVQESDVLACAQSVVEGSGDVVAGSGDRYWDVDVDNIALAGHSQGGGAVIKAGDGNKDITIEAVLAMNPYGPAWVRPENQTGPVLILGGRFDTTTPPESYQVVADAIIGQGTPGGINAISLNGTHNSDAWGTYPDGSTMSWQDAQEEDFANFQAVGTYWWGVTLTNDPGGANLNALELALCDEATWEQPVQHGGVAGFSCP